MRPLPRTSWKSSYFSTNGARPFSKASPVTRARSTMSSSSIVWRVASAATMASWLRPKVEEWTTARSIFE